MIDNTNNKKSICENLRKTTGFSLMDCKQALIKFNYDEIKAAAYLGSSAWRKGKLL